MNFMQLRRLWLLGSALALVFGGCSKPSTDDTANSNGASGGSSGGLLSRMLETTKPIVVPEGSSLLVSVDETLASNKSNVGDSFAASMAEPVEMNGRAVIPRGARVVGRVVEAKESGRLHGVAQLAVTLTSIEVDGKSYDLETNSFDVTAKSHNKRNAEFIGGGAAGGALIGALAGRGKGALIGGLAGAGAGTAGAAVTGKKDVSIPAETRLKFRLVKSLTVSVKS